MKATPEIKKEIELVNNIIAHAIIHGGDAGGSYESNAYGLISAVHDWLDAKGLSDSCRVVGALFRYTLPIPDPFGSAYGNESEMKYHREGSFTVLKIVPKDENDDEYGEYEELYYDAPKS